MSRITGFKIVFFDNGIIKFKPKFKKKFIKFHQKMEQTSKVMVFGVTIGVCLYIWYTIATWLVRLKHVQEFTLGKS